MQNIESTLNSTRGRFFTLVTKNGEAFNAQSRGLTKCYVKVFDRNANRVRRVAKNNIGNIVLVPRPKKNILVAANSLDQRES